jgi:acetolactate synthase I/II/III large subunit
LSTSADPASAVVAALAGAGTRLVFGVPGGGPNLDVVGAAAAAGLRFVLARGETAATIMAATYADLTGTPGAVVVTRGPGLASAVNGIAHAALDRLPVVVIADTVRTALTAPGDPSSPTWTRAPPTSTHWSHPRSRCRVVPERRPGLEC